MGPSILARIATRDDQQLTALVHTGLPARGMPPTQLNTTEMAGLLRYLHSIQRRFTRPVVRMKAETTDGRILEGQVVGEGFDDVQLRSDDKRVHLLRRAGARFREVTSETNWPTYNGETGGNRFTTLSQINKNNISKLASKWVFTVPNAGRLQVTPVVVDGIMYVTAPNECYALDAGSGRQIWHYQVPSTPGTLRDAGANRGVGVAGDRVFLETGSAHILALNRYTGELLWNSELADFRQNYFATSAPLPAGDLVIEIGRAHV